MADVADYRVIRDSGLVLQTGDDIDHTIDFDLGTKVQHGQQCVLQWHMESASNASNLTYQLLINDKGARKYTVTGKFFGTMHEVTARGITHDNENKLKVVIVNGSGKVTVSDIVLWVQRSV